MTELSRMACASPGEVLFVCFVCAYIRVYVCHAYMYINLLNFSHPCIHLHTYRCVCVNLCI